MSVLAVRKAKQTSWGEVGRGGLVYLAQDPSPRLSSLCDDPSLPATSILGWNRVELSLGLSKQRKRQRNPEPRHALSRAARLRSGGTAPQTFPPAAPLCYAMATPCLWRRLAAAPGHPWPDGVRSGPTPAYIPPSLSVGAGRPRATGPGRAPALSACTLRDDAPGLIRAMAMIRPKVLKKGVSSTTCC